MSQKSRREGSAVEPYQSQLVLIMEKLSLDVMPRKDSAFIAALVIQPIIVDRIKEVQKQDTKCAKLKAMYSTQYGREAPLLDNEGGDFEKRTR